MTAKSKKLVKNMNESKRLMKSMDAFTKESMYYNDYEVKEYVNDTFGHHFNNTSDW